MVDNFQKASMALKYALVPTVAAVRGLCFGGGCEFQMHATRTVAALESYIGLVEAGVGLLPAGGGLKELALRAAQQFPDDPFEGVKRVFETVWPGGRQRWKHGSWACCANPMSWSQQP